MADDFVDGFFGIHYIMAAYNAKQSKISALSLVSPSVYVLLFPKQLSARNIDTIPVNIHKNVRVY